MPTYPWEDIAGVREGAGFFDASRVGEANAERNRLIAESDTAEYEGASLSQMANLQNGIQRQYQTAISPTANPMILEIPMVE